ncbi:MAG: NADPH:quinone reductase, partial [Bryobacteraceae bacterium]
VQAVAVNPIDTYIRAGKFPLRLRCPFIVGRDITGIVTEIGSAVTRFRPGDPVWANNQGYAGRQGTFAEYCAVREELLYPLPPGLDFRETVAVLHSALTAILGLQYKAKLVWGETLFVNGGDGNVGNAVVRIAKALGARIAVTSSNPEKAEWIRGAGADAVFDYKREDIGAALKKFAPDGVNIFWDASPKPDATLAVHAAAQRGRIVIMAGGQYETAFPSGRFYQKNCTLYGFTVTDATAEELKLYAAEINRWLEQGILQARIDRTLPLSQAAEAHRLVESGHTFGKIILEPER